jgi:hypothetical protein
MLNDMKKTDPRLEKLAVKHQQQFHYPRYGHDRSCLQRGRVSQSPDTRIVPLLGYSQSRHECHHTIFRPRGALLFESYVETLAAIVTCAYSRDRMVKARLDREWYSEETRGRIERCDPETSAWACCRECYLLRDLDKFVKSVRTNPGLYTKSSGHHS